MNEEEKILKQWITLKESGVERAKVASRKLFFISMALTGIVVALIFLKANSIFIALVSTAIGWSIAERNALRSRVNLWPKLEKYLSWEAIHERLSK